MPKQPDYRQLYDSMLEAFNSLNQTYFVIEIIYDKEGKAADFRYLEINSAVEKLFGKSRADIVGKTRNELFGAKKENSDVILETYEKLAKTGEPVHFESYGTALGKYYETYAWKVGNQIHAMSADVTKRSKAKEVLRTRTEQLENTQIKLEQKASEVEEYACRMEELVRDRTEKLERTAKYARNLIEASPDPLVTISAEGKITDVNEATEKATGCSREELIGSNFSNYFTEPKKAEEGYKRVFTEGLVRDYPLTIRSKTGAITYVLYNATVYCDEQGKIQGVFAAARDITERKMLEGKILQKAREVELERQRLYNVLESLPARVILLTDDYHVAFANRAFRDKFGDSGGKYCYEYCFGYTSPCSFCESYVPMTTGKMHHWTVKLPDSSVVEAYDYPFIDVDGSRKILEMSFDISDRVKLENQLHNAERLAAIGATAGMVGHDIRNPLQAITGDVFLAKTELESLPDSEAKINALENLREIEGNTEYINKIVQDLQDYARPLNPKLEESDIEAIVKKILQKNTPLHNIRAYINVEGKARQVSTDSYYLNRILYNLITNAVQAMPNGGELTINAKQEGTDIAITVSDTGVGIPVEIQPKLFVVMFTTKSKGQGFGLPVVKRMTESMGGTVTFESKEGKGTTFSIRLPTKK